MLFALLWKESNEHFRKFLAAIALFIIFFIPFFFWNDLTQQFQNFVLGFFFPTCWLLPIWMAASTVTSEKITRTQRLLSAIPLRPRKIFFVKTAASLLIILLPMSLLLLYLSTKDSNLPAPHEWLNKLLGITSLYLMITALSTHYERETSAAMCGVLLTIIAFFWVLLEQDIASDKIRFWLIAPNPLASIIIPDINRYDKETIRNSLSCVQLAMIALWWSVGLFRYNTSPTYRHPAPIPHTTSRLAHLPASLKKIRPSNSIFRMLLWREFREQGWIILAAAAAGFLVAALAVVLTDPDPRFPKLAQTAHIFAQSTLSLSMFIPAIVAILLGVSVWATDIHSKFSDFWRSRPISPDALFWSKFLTALLGILALMTTFALTSLACTAYANSHGIPFNPYTDSSDQYEFYTTAPIALAAILSTAILTTLLVRRPLYAAIITLASVLITFFAIIQIFEPLSDFLLHQIQVYLSLATIIALSLSHRALSRNWQLKSPIPHHSQTLTLTGGN